MPATRAEPFGDLRLRVRRFTRRRRRPLAAGLAAIAALVALTSLRAPGPAASSPTGPATAASTLIAGEVAVPVTLPNAALVRTVSEGQVVDVVRVPRDESLAAAVVARDARIIDIPEGGSTFSASSTPVVVVAVKEADVLPLVATSSRDTLMLVFRGSHESPLASAATAAHGGR